MVLNDEIREKARENARRFFAEKSEVEVKDVFRHADFYGSSTTHGTIEKNIYFSDFGMLSEKHKVDGRFNICTGSGVFMRIHGWIPEFDNLVDVKELKTLYLECQSNNELNNHH